MRLVIWKPLRSLWRHRNGHYRRATYLPILCVFQTLYSASSKVVPPRYQGGDHSMISTSTYHWGISSRRRVCRILTQSQKLVTPSGVPQSSFKVCLLLYYWIFAVQQASHNRSDNGSAHNMLLCHWTLELLSQLIFSWAMCYYGRNYSLGSQPQKSPMILWQSCKENFVKATELSLHHYRSL